MSVVATLSHTTLILSKAAEREAGEIPSWHLNCSTVKPNGMSTLDNKQLWKCGLMMWQGGRRNPVDCDGWDGGCGAEGEESQT